MESRFKAVIGAVVLAGLVALGIPTGVLRQSVHDGIPSVSPGQTWETSLAEVTVHEVERTDEEVALSVTITPTVTHSVTFREVVGFEVDGDPDAVFTSRSHGVPIYDLNPQVPVDVTITYRFDEEDDEIHPIIVDGVWQTQDENALQLPDHLVLRRPVARVVA